MPPSESLPEHSYPVPKREPRPMDFPLGFGDYNSLVAYGTEGVLPDDPAELHRLALEVICSRGVPNYLTPYGAIRAVAAFAIDAKDDAFYNDGKVLLKAALALREREAIRIAP